ncbi:MAG TPA: hypothetical protein EYO33_06720 [Phycisphaerales bacterium]|nr:hypothetical protein [Phycisphaerales bacterium]
MVAEVLLQSTPAETISSIYPAFSTSSLSSKRLSRATEGDLSVFPQPLGLCGRRAATLKNLALEMVRMWGRFLQTHDELESMLSVGLYVASAVLVQVNDEPVSLFDIVMAQVLDRLFHSA